MTVCSASHQKILSRKVTSFGVAYLGSFAYQNTERSRRLQEVKDGKFATHLKDLGGDRCAFQNSLNVGHHEIEHPEVMVWDK
jgi:hypothetical protein